ncbi:LysR family transcriptional regulator [Salicibibacter cibarius]|uniref:LysR family transcriptional regulator n=1 Tax=Salicibibacter cibarius TaxID=2743000 RepID=A0A7T6Z6A8_9BACI|nr:LysR family transcriptional regulator [Salicibibacter cibarius]QQK77803.1 LysR family transcriptional regulator [Salicibibacter cibarius]
MNIEQLEYIVEVAKTRSISVASVNLHVSQSGISKSITNLEHELGVKIFTRSRMGAIPTETGLKLINNAYEVLIGIQKIEEEAKILNGELSPGKLKLATIPSMLMTYLPKTLANFKKDYPYIQVEITEQGSLDIINDIEQNNVDIGLIVLIEECKDHLNGTLVETEINVCVSKNSLLAYNEIITPKDLVNQPIVLYNSHLWERFFQKHLSGQKGINILFSSNSTEVIKKTVAEGLSIGFSTDLALKGDQYVQKGDIVPIPFVNNEVAIRSYGWIHPKNKHFTLEAKKFLHYLKTQIVKGDI